jgi:hypothetical protein
MEYKEFKEMIVEYLSGNLTEVQQDAFEQFLTDHPAYTEEFEAVKLLWDGEDAEVPKPTSAMDVKFYTMLNAEEKKQEKTSIFTKVEQLFFGGFSKQLVYTLAILTIGFFVGNGFDFGKEKPQVKVAEAQKETEKVRSQLVLTLLDQPSANKRLQAVNEVDKLNTVTATIIRALFSTLNNDDNVNVRLSAIEALKNYTDRPLVREGLVASIIHQKSPLVQIELADLMVILQEKKAVKPLKELLKEKDVNTNAKQKMEESIERII